MADPRDVAERSHSPSPLPYLSPHSRSASGTQYQSSQSTDWSHLASSPLVGGEGAPQVEEVRGAEVAVSVSVILLRKRKGFTRGPRPLHGQVRIPLETATDNKETELERSDDSSSSSSGRTRLRRRSLQRMPLAPCPKVGKRRTGLLGIPKTLVSEQFL